MNKFLYKYFTNIYLIFANIRMTYYTLIGRLDKARKIPYEHFKF